jgi:hypothetical protein
MRQLALPMQVSGDGLVAGPNGDSTGLSGLLEMIRGNHARARGPSRNREARGRNASAVNSVVEEWARSRVAGGEARPAAGYQDCPAVTTRFSPLDSWGSI